MEVGRFRMGGRTVKEEYVQGERGFSGKLFLSGKTSRKIDREAAVAAVEYIRKETPDYNGEIKADKSKIAA